MDNFEKLVSDIRSCGGFVSDKITVRNSPESGRGLFAKKTIKVGEKLINVPNKFLINCKTIKLSDFELREKFELSSFQLLTLFLCYEKKFPNLYWKNFIDSLPDLNDFDGLPLTWSDSEVDFLPNSMKDHTFSMRKKLEIDYTEVKKCLSDSETILNYNLFLWAWLCVNTRCLFTSFENKSHDDCISLVPFVDMFNHKATDSPYEHCTIQYSIKTGFTVYSKKDSDYISGEELLFSYGPHSNEFLLSEYGFMLPYIENKCNFLDLTDRISQMIFSPDHDPKGKLYKYLKNYNYSDDYTINSSNASFRVEIALLSYSILHGTSWINNDEEDKDNKNVRKVYLIINGLNDIDKEEEKIINMMLKKILLNEIEDCLKKLDTLESDNRKLKIIREIYFQRIELAKNYLKNNSCK